MATKKNQTSWKSLDIIETDPRINQCFSEGEDGIWLWLNPGWTCEAKGAHDGHEWTVRELLRVYRRIEPCDCDGCRANR